jgi:16S rRNA (uracil1498-N3)-methyltransferase
LFVDAPLVEGDTVELGDGQTHYLTRVLRLMSGDALLVFNGRQGEHSATIGEVGRRHCRLMVGKQTRPQEWGPDVDYLFAPLKRARLDYMVQKATELGVRRMRPVLTEHTMVERINLGRMRSNMIEAAEQCGLLWLPEVLEPLALDRMLDDWETGRHLVFADESAVRTSPIEAISRLAPGPVAVLVGPEGGFSERERRRLLEHDFVTAIGLGPRVMRADTAAVAALALVNAVLGDWR